MTTAYRPTVVKDTDYWVVKHNNIFQKVQYNNHGDKYITETDGKYVSPDKSTQVFKKLKDNSQVIPYNTEKDGKYVIPISTTGEYVLAKLDEYIYEEMEEQKPKPNQWFGF